MKRSLCLPSGSSGFALVSALMLLVALTVVVIALVRTNTLEMRMAHNLEAKVGVDQRTQAVVDAVYDIAVETPSQLPIQGNAGQCICIDGLPTGCIAGTPTLVLPSAIGAPSSKPSYSCDARDSSLKGLGYYARARLEKVDDQSIVPPGITMLATTASLARIEAGYKDDTTNARGETGIGILRGSVGRGGGVFFDVTP